MKFSIIIITFNRHKELWNCLESIKKADIKIPHEVIVIFNGDRTYLEKCAQTFKNYTMQFVHKTTPANARNHGILKANGEFFFFLDDDCILPENYFSHLSFDSNWDVIGGPDQTPSISTHFQQIVGKALSSPLCMGPTLKRHTISKTYNVDADEKSLILCNLWFRASLFKKENYLFNPELFRNEENYLLKELKSENKKIHYSPQLFVYHQRKKNLETLGISIVKSGETRVQNFSLQPVSKELIYFMPIIWLFALFYLIFNPQSLVLYLYASYTSLIAIQYILKFKKLSFLYIVLHYFILAMYAIGLMKGFWKYFPQLYTSLRENKSLINESKSR
jgi:glycosyltransferase involved in cell wall biosynthesis